MSSKVAILCSAYNPGAELIDSVESVLNQSFRDFVFLIIDDASTETSALDFVATKYRKDDRLKIVKNKINRGLTYNLAENIEKIRSEFIARLDVGDIWMQGKLKKQIEFMEAHLDYIAVGSQVDYVDKDYRYIGRSWFSVENDEIQRSIKEHKGIFEHSSILFRNIINYRQPFYYSQDLDLYLRMSLRGKLFCIDEHLCKCFVNASGISIQKRPLQIKYQNLAYKSYFARIKNKPEVDLCVRQGLLGMQLWKIGSIFFKKYVEMRTQGSVSCYLYLLICCMIYPPIGINYIQRVVLPK